MGRIPEEALSEIRSRIDIVDLVGRYITLKKAGSNLKGLCPFHSEKTPSFNVNPGRQTFYCFGCSKGGDVISFLRDHENLTFPEAARSLARECGVEIPETGGDEQRRGVSEQIFAANEVAQRVYHEALRADEGQAACEYLKGRGLSGQDVKDLGVGYAPDRWDSVANELAREGIPAEIGASAGLLKERGGQSGHYDLLRGRITFPIRDVRGRIVGFGGRALAPDQEPKYLNSPESPVFRKREGFYGFPDALSAIRSAGRAIVCEGYFDRIALHRAGLSEGLATCGTALTQEHARQLKRRTRTVVLLFDGDEAGQKAMERALAELLPEGLRVRVAVLPEGQDPDDLLANEGPEALRKLVDAAASGLDAVIRRAVLKGCRTPAEQADAVDHVAPLVALVPNPVEREGFVRALAGSVGAGVAAVASIVRAAAGPGGGAAREKIPAAPTRPRLDSNEERGVRLVALAVLRAPSIVKPSLVDAIAQWLPACDWKDLAGLLAGVAQGGATSFDVHALSAELEGALRERLHELAADEGSLSEEADPEQVVSDVLAWFEKRQRKSERTGTTHQLRESGVDATSVLAEKDRQLAQKREIHARRKGPGTPRLSP